MKFTEVLDERQYPGLGPILSPPKHNAFSLHISQWVMEVGALSKYYPDLHFSHYPVWRNASPEAHFSSAILWVAWVIELMDRFFVVSKLAVKTSDKVVPGSAVIPTPWTAKSPWVWVIYVKFERMPVKLLLEAFSILAERIIGLLKSKSGTIWL